MEYKVEEIRFKSSDKINSIYAKIMSPCDYSTIKGVLQFSHGMCEYAEKYEEFFKYMIENGYAVCVHDHLGHGKTVKTDDDLGFFGEENGYKFLIEDTYLMTLLAKKRFPNVPFFLMGHSMGSLIARNYVLKYGEKINGMLLCGTVGPQWMIDTGIQMADMIISKKGMRYRSRKLDQLAFEFANLKIQDVSTKYEWVCSDEEVVTEHAKDKRNDFIFTVTGFKDLFYLVKECNDEKKIKNTPKNLPIYIFSGKEDPIGEYGEGVKKVNILYKKVCKNVTMKLYDGCRHEMLNEKNKEEVYKEILDWIELVKFGEE